MNTKIRAIAFLSTLTVTFIGLTAGWVSAAHASEASCRRIALDNGADSVLMCEGAALPEAPRGTARKLPKVKANQTNHVAGESVIGPRVGTTVIIARLGVRS